MTVTGFVPPPYPYDRLGEIARSPAKHDGGAVDLSIGTPCDPPPRRGDRGAGRGHRGPRLPAVDRHAGVARGRGRLDRAPARRHRRPGHRARRLRRARKEFVASTPQYLKLRDPTRDTVLYPAISYPTYEMGATLAGLRAVPYQQLDDIADADADRPCASG